MIYKKRNRVGRLPFWQAFSTHAIFLICAVSGLLYLLAHEFDIMLLPIKNYTILITHGFSAYFFAMLFGAVLPSHIKTAWKGNRNKASGSLMILVMSLLLISGLFLYYGADTRDAALWVHWIIGSGLVVLFPFHFIAGRRANYIAMKHPTHRKKQKETVREDTATVG